MISIMDRKTSFNLACFFLVVGSAFMPAQAADLHFGNMDADRILFLGNSITYHPLLPSINWYGEWGMAASSADKDYVHVLTDKIAEVAGGTPYTMVANIFTFEIGYNSYDIETNLAAELAFDPDIVVLAIGENVSALNTVEAQEGYAAAYGNLLSVLKNNGNPAIFARGCFWSDPTKDAIMEAAVLAAGGWFVNIGDLSADPANYAYSEPTYADPQYSIFNSHPGDAGMAAIADRIYGSMAAHALPEPGSAAMLAVGLIGLAWFAWMRRR